MTNAPTFKQPTRADKAVQAGVLAHVRHTPPDEQATDESALVANRFETTSPRTVTLLDDDIEYCIDVMDEASERVWHIAAWPHPSGTQLEVSHCLVVGSKSEAREVLHSVTGAPAQKPHNRAHGARTPGYVGRSEKKPR